MRDGQHSAGKAHAPGDAVKLEWLKCRASPVYFVNTYVQIGVQLGMTFEGQTAMQDSSQSAGGWARFELWPAQATLLAQMAHAPRLVILKARQLGISWLCLAYALWLMAVRGPATVLLFSLREAEAKELLARLRGMYARLPRWLQARAITQDAATVFALSTGSRALAFSTRAGRSYTGTLALVDEADFVPELAAFLNGVKPTIDGGGQLFLVSTSDKARPRSPFKRLFRAARAGATGANNPGAGGYVRAFLPWHAHPARDAVWHARTKAEMFAQRGTDDDFLAEYPATVEEALAPEQLDRRLPLAWVMACRAEGEGLEGEGLDAARLRRDGNDARLRRDGNDAPGLPGLTVYVEPQPGAWYVIGADPAEGNPHSDESAAVVLDGAQWAEAATLAGRFEPGVFAEYLAALAAYFNQAGVLVERNNHGHAVLHALATDGATTLLRGYDGKPGWLNNVRGKPLLYSRLAEALRTRACVVRSVETANQLASIQASDLRAPAGLHDDRATAFGLAVAALAGDAGSTASTPVPPVDPLAGVDAAVW